jgi:hypothetical protein
LADEGIGATQATVSRDLEDLGAVKVRVPGGETVYAIPEYEPARIAPEDQLRRVMGEWGCRGHGVGLRRRSAHAAWLRACCCICNRSLRHVRFDRNGRGRRHVDVRRRGVDGGKALAQSSSRSFAGLS